MAKTTTKKQSVKKPVKKGAKAPKKTLVVKKKARKEISPVKPIASKPTPSQKGYGKKDLEYFRNIILEKRKEILEELESLRDTMMDSETGEYTNENPTYSTHMEQGTDTMEREKTFLFASRESKFFNYLEDALKRIDSGEYGRCTSCGKLIEKERLEAVPHAQQCLVCKLQRGK